MAKKKAVLEPRSIFHRLAGLDLIFLLTAAVITIVVVVEIVLR